MKYKGPLFFLLMNVLLACNDSHAQTSDDQFRQPLKDVLVDLQSRFGISIRFTEELVKDKWVTYAGWRYRNDIEQTLTNILAAHDISFTKEADKKYKLQAYQYHLKTKEEGKEQLQYLSSLYHDVKTWNARRDSLKRCLLTSLQLDKLPAKTLSVPILTPVRKYKNYTVQNIAIET